MDIIAAVEGRLTGPVAAGSRLRCRAELAERNAARFASGVLRFASVDDSSKSLPRPGEQPSALPPTRRASFCCTFTAAMLARWPVSGLCSEFRSGSTRFARVKLAELPKLYVVDMGRGQPSWRLRTNFLSVMCVM